MDTVRQEGRIIILLLVMVLLPGCSSKEYIIKPGREVLFHELPLGSFFDGNTGKNLEESGGYVRGKGRFGWNVPCTTCLFDGKRGSVEDYQVGNYILCKFIGREVNIKVGMAFYGDHLKVTIDPGAKNEVDGGWLNTCANTDFKEVYPDGRAPRNKIKPKWKEGERFNPEGQYLQEFKVARNLKKGLHVLKIEHTWSKDIDSGGDDFNHLYSIWVK